MFSFGQPSLQLSWLAGVAGGCLGGFTRMVDHIIGQKKKLLDCIAIKLYFYTMLAALNQFFNELVRNFVHLEIAG